MKRNPYDGLRKFILAAMIIVPFVPFITVCGIGYYHFTSSLENSTIASMRRIVHDHRRMIESFLVERKADLEGSTYREAIRTGHLFFQVEDGSKKGIRQAESPTAIPGHRSEVCRQ
jgi:hypothetical protein